MVIAWSNRGGILRLALDDKGLELGELQSRFAQHDRIWVSCSHDVLFSSWSFSFVEP